MRHNKSESSLLRIHLHHHEWKLADSGLYFQVCKVNCKSSCVTSTLHWPRYHAHFHFHWFSNHFTFPKNNLIFRENKVLFDHRYYPSPYFPMFILWSIIGEHSSWGWHVTMSSLSYAGWSSRLLSIVSDISGRTHTVFSKCSWSTGPAVEVVVVVVVVVNCWQYLKRQLEKYVTIKHLPLLNAF